MAYNLTKCAYNVPTTFQKDFVPLHSVLKLKIMADFFLSAYSGDSRSPIPMISVHSVGYLLYRRQS